MYTYRYGWYYDHIVWIDGKNRSTIENSFRTLATDHLKKTANEKQDEIFVILEQVIATLCKKSLLLLIFDNATENNVEVIQELLRHSLTTDLVKPTVLVTSRSPNWDRDRDQHRNNIVFNIGMLSEDEGVAFTLKQLSIDSTYENRTEALELGKLVENFPPALHLAVGLIREQSKLELVLPEKKQKFQKIYGIQNLIDDYKYKERKLRLPMLKSDSENVMLVLCNVAFNMLNRVKNGDMTVKLLNTMAYLCPSSSDSIRKEFLLALFEGGETGTEGGDFLAALQLLCDYSLVTKSKQYYSIHPLIQKVVISNIPKQKQSSRPRHNVLIFLTEKLKRLWHVISPSSPIYENFLQTTLQVTNCVFAKLQASEFSEKSEDKEILLRFMEFVDENLYEVIKLSEDGNTFERIIMSEYTKINSEFHRKRRRYKSRRSIPIPDEPDKGLPVNDKKGDEDDDALPKYTEVLWDDKELNNANGFFPTGRQPVNKIELKSKTDRHDLVVPTSVKKEENKIVSELIKEIERFLGLGSNKESKTAALKLIHDILAAKEKENREADQGTASPSPSILAVKKCRTM